MTSTNTWNPAPEQPAADDRSSTIGSDVPAADSRPVGGGDLQRHDSYRGSGIEPISQVVEGMRVFDATAKEVGKVEFVKLGDPEAITTLGEETDNGEPRVAGELRGRLLRLGFIKVDRKGFFTSDGYVAADEIDCVRDGAVHLAVTDKEILKKADG